MIPLLKLCLGDKLDRLGDSSPLWGTVRFFLLVGLTPPGDTCPEASLRSFRDLGLLLSLGSGILLHASTTSGNSLSMSMSRLTACLPVWSPDKRNEGFFFFRPRSWGLPSSSNDLDLIPENGFRFLDVHLELLDFFSRESAGAVPGDPGLELEC